MHPLPADPLNIVPEPHESAKAYLAKAKPATKPAGAYRPPGARGTTTPLHFKREDEGGAAYVSNGVPAFGASNGFGPGKGRRREVPGAELAEGLLPPGAAPGGGVSLAGVANGTDEGLSKAALKNKKKREAKKAKEAADREKGLNTEGVEGAPKAPRAMSSSPNRQNPHHRRNRSGYEHSPQFAPHHGRSPHRGPPGLGHHPKQQGRPYPQQQQYQQQEYQQQQTPPAAAPTSIDTSMQADAPDLTVTSPGGASAHEKKVRSLLKKLRAIEELKMRQAGGEKLEATQIQKITTEEGVRRELEGLGGG